jgi:hypothetical protein
LYTPFELASMPVPIAPPARYAPKANATSTAPQQKPGLAKIPEPPNNCDNDKDKKPSTLYRGTNRYAELQAFFDTAQGDHGYIMSDAAIQGYYEGGNSLQNALSVSKNSFNQQLTILGSLQAYAEAHASLGATEFTQKYGPRALISFTDDLSRARFFANINGRGNVFQVELSQVASTAIKQTLSSSGEGEWLIPNMVWAKLKE